MVLGFQVFKMIEKIKFFINNYLCGKHCHKDTNLNKHKTTKEKSSEEIFREKFFVQAKAADKMFKEVSNRENNISKKTNPIRKKYNRKNKPNNDYFVSPLGNSFNSCNSKED